MTAADTDTLPAPVRDGDADDASHIAAHDHSAPGMRLNAATKTPIRALCGAESVPRPRGNRPVCTRCAEIAGAQRITPVDWLMGDAS